jgi:acetate kinase
MLLGPLFDKIGRKPMITATYGTASLSALGGADAIVFGGGIGENTPLVRERVCTSLRWCGLELDAERNRTLIELEGKVTTAASTLPAFVALTEEGLQIAHECIQAL